MRKFLISVNGNSYEVDVEEISNSSTVSMEAANDAVASVSVAKPAPVEPKKNKSVAIEGALNVTAPMPGNIVTVKVNVGDVVKSGDVLCIIEAMKMENEIMASKDGKIVAINAEKGALVNAGDVLFAIT